MILVSFNSADAFLLDDAPNWEATPSLDATIPASYERGLSGRETRRGVGDTLRLAFAYSALIHGSPAVTNLRNSLQSLNTQPVLCPLWPAEFIAGTLPLISSAFYVLFNADGSFSSIQPASALGTGFSKDACPLMVGMLSELPDPEMFTDNFAQVDFKFVENDVYALTPAAFMPPGGIAAAAGARPLFPWRADWSDAPKSGGSEVDVDRQQIGQLRQTSSAYFAQPGRRRVAQDFTLQNDEPWNLLAFFSSLAGEQNNFWLPAALSEAALTADVLAADVVLNVDNVAARGANTFVILDDNNNRTPLKITGTTGNAWNLSAAPGVAYSKNLTRIESLVLARFDVLKISLNFTTPALVRVSLKFKETPWETAAVAGETINVTMGALPTTAILFIFTVAIPAAPEVSYFTSFERDLTDATNNYLSAPLEFDSVTETATLERQSCRLKSRNFTGNPLALLIPFQLEWPLLVDIYEADVTGSNVPTIATLQAAGRCLFSGEVSTADIDPPYISATCDSMRSIFDRNIPRRLFQKTCNWVLFESACGLLPADWQWNAVVVSYSATTSTLVIGTITSANTAVLVAHFFSAGYFKLTHAGAVQVRMVSDSTIVAGGQMTLLLSTPLATAPSAGDVVNLFAGCDGQKKTCQPYDATTNPTGKFNNYLHFGGFPFIPTGNPSVLKINNNTGAAGKK